MITLNGMTQAQILALIEAGSVTLNEALDFVEARVIKRETGFTKTGAPRKGSAKALGFLRANGRRRPNDTTAVKVEAAPAPVTPITPITPAEQETDMDALLKSLASLGDAEQDEVMVAWMAMVVDRTPAGDKPKAKRKAKK